MREILFRGRALWETEWSFGDLGHSKDGQAYIETHYEPDCWKSRLRHTPVNSETVSQYTGLKDKNGTKIFEGDIVLLPEFYIGQERIPESKATVIWGDGGWELQEISKLPGASVLDEQTGLEMTIIGNIWDNPELLEKEEKP